MLSLLSCLIALNGPYEVHRLQTLFLSLMTAVSVDTEKVGTSKASHIRAALKNKKNNHWPFRLLCNISRLFYFPSVPLLWLRSSSIKLSHSKLGELVTPVLNPSSCPLLNHPPSNPLSLTAALDRLHALAAFTLKLLRWDTYHWPLSWGPWQPSRLSDTHTNTNCHALIFSPVSLASTHEHGHTQFPGNHPHFPSNIQSHSTPSPRATLLHFPPASR